MQDQWDKARKEMGFRPYRYKAVHCRVRHPRATPGGVFVPGKWEGSTADQSGLPWYGKNREFAGSLLPMRFNVRVDLTSKAIRQSSPFRTSLSTFSSIQTTA